MYVYTYIWQVLTSFLAQIHPLKKMSLSRPGSHGAWAQALGLVARGPVPGDRGFGPGAWGPGPKAWGPRA